MVELNEKALEAAHHAYQTHEQMGDLKTQRLSDSCLTAVITAYFADLPAPDDGLEGIDIEQLARTIVLTCQYSWPKDRVKAFERAERLISSALQSQAAELQHLRSDAENPDKGMWTFWNDKARELSEQTERQKRSIQELEESVSALEAERQNIIATKREQIERLTQERDEALAAEDEAKDSFWAIYPDWVKLKGHGISTEAARTMLAQRAEAAEQQVQKLTALVEQAFRDGLTYGGNVDNADADLAWSQSRIRSALETQEGGE